MSDFLPGLVSGGVAGLAVDISLYPLDTIKTRMQSAEGFGKAGGFNGVFKGLGPAALGSFPGAALFFATYEGCKDMSASSGQTHRPYVTHLLAAVVGETVACLVRVPTENVKQNLQINRYSSMTAAFRGLYARTGVSAFYNGYASTLLREIPFSCIQFPLWEAGKLHFRPSPEEKCAPLTSALLGSASGAFAAGLTTPLDVVKTRLMTSSDRYRSGVVGTIRTVIREEGWGALFRGVEPRVMWIGIGGFVFFGAYEKTRSLIFASSNNSDSTLVK